MTHWQVDIQLATRTPAAQLPDLQKISHWLTHSAPQLAEAEVTIRIVDEEESRHLNYTYRHNNKATNVLSFPFEVPEDIDLPLLGDLVICAPVVISEAQEQDKAPEAHWAHLVLHGILHLQGFDHQTEQDAAQMESLEIELLAALGYGNPYA